MPGGGEAETVITAAKYVPCGYPGRRTKEDCHYDTRNYYDRNVEQLILVTSEGQQILHTTFQHV